MDRTSGIGVSFEERYQGETALEVYIVLNCGQDVLLQFRQIQVLGTDELRDGDALSPGQDLLILDDTVVEFVVELLPFLDVGADPWRFS
ncbi:MAG: hypothetical protein ABSG53_24320 [Thermoguttaceae bacterium]|jgi:hypothetical protein